MISRVGLRIKCEVENGLNQWRKHEERLKSNVEWKEEVANPKTKINCPFINIFPAKECCHTKYHWNGHWKEPNHNGNDVFVVKHNFVREEN